MSTQSTVVAVFQSNSEAQAADDELEQNGFSQSDIYVTSGSSGQASSTAAAPSSYDTGTRHEGGVTGWFKRVFEGEETDRPHYENHLRGGTFVVSVDTKEENIGRG